MFAKKSLKHFIQKKKSLKHSSQKKKEIFKALLIVLKYLLIKRKIVN